MGFIEGITKNRGTSLLVQIVEDIAAREGVDPLDLTPPLFDAVDSEIIELLSGKRIGDDQGGVCLQFRYHGYKVTVEGEDVQITPT